MNFFPYFGDDLLLEITLRFRNSNILVIPEIFSKIVIVYFPEFSHLDFAVNKNSHLKNLSNKYYGQVMLKAPVTIRSPKFISIEPAQSSDV